MDENFTQLVEQLAAHCIKGGIKLACAESCTGGMLASTFVDVPGSSEWFDCGLVVYSDVAKQKFLGVDPKTLAHYGAVSKEVAQDLAQGLLQRSSANITVSITGIAGPDGGSDEKPVGTVWFAFATRRGNMKTAHHVFLGSRQEVRMQAVDFVLKELLQTEL
jgi:nicotinamide-nucleotide amidase